MNTRFCLLIWTLCVPYFSRGGLIYESNVMVQTFVGSGFYGLVDGTGTETMFNQPSAIAFGVDGGRTNLFISDFGNRVLRIANHVGEVVASRGMISSAAATDGNGFAHFLVPDAVWILAPYGPIVNSFSFFTNVSPNCRIALDSKNNVYASLPEENRIYTYDSGRGSWSVFVGSGNPGNVDGRGIFCSFLQPRGLAFDSADNLYVADFGNRSIRKIAPDRTVTTFLVSYGDDNDGTWPFVSLSHCAELAVDRFGNIFVAQPTRVRKVSPTKRVTTLAGAPSSPGFWDGDGRYALFRDLSSICISPSGDIYVADKGDHRIRRITLSPAEQPASSQLHLGLYSGLSITGIVGRTYRIETATDLNASNWTAAATIQLPESPHLWIDRENTPRQRKFYRAFLLP